MSEAPIYDSAARLAPPIEEIGEVVKYRHLIGSFIRRDIVTRYKRSALGVMWTMLNPLGTMIIMTIVFSQIFRIQQPYYPIYVLTGLITWNFFAQTSGAAPQTLLWSGSLVHRVYVPRTVFALTSVGVGLVNMALSLVPLGVVMLILHRPPNWTVVFVPLAMLLLAGFALGVGLLLSTLVVYFPDIIDIYSIVLVAWMYMSAVFYPYAIIPIEYRWWFFNLNPMYHLMLLFRDPLYYGNPPSWAHILAAVFVSVTTLFVGWLVFTRRADELAYRI